MALGVGVHTSGQTTASSITSSNITTTAGSGLVVGYLSDAGTFVSITDNKGNGTPIQINTELGATAKTRLYYWPYLSTAGASHTVTVTVNASSKLTIFVQEVTAGNANGITLDQSNRADDAASPFGDAVTITTTIAAEMLISLGFGVAGGITDPDTWTAGASFTMQENQTTVSTGLYSGALGTRAVASTSTYNGSWTALQTTTGRMWIASFSEVPDDNVLTPAIYGLNRNAMIGLKYV